MEEPLNDTYFREKKMKSEVWSRKAMVNRLLKCGGLIVKKSKLFLLCTLKPLQIIY